MDAPEKTVSAFSRTALRRLAAAERVWKRSPELRGEVGYLPRVFVAVNLPHTNPGDIAAWSRINGDASLTVQPGYVTAAGKLIAVGYPFGSTARWLLIFIFTEAVRQKSPRVSLNSSLGALLRALGLPCEGRRMTTVKGQLHRLLAASIRFSFRDRALLAGSNLSIASEYLLWRQEATPRVLGFVILNEVLFRDLISHPVPLDLGAIRALRDSPLAMDLFIWLSFRLRSLRHPLSLSWLALQSQFGSDYSATKEFARHVRRELRRVHVVWPTLKTNFYRGGVTFYPPSELPVKMRRRQ